MSFGFIFHFIELFLVRFVYFFSHQLLDAKITSVLALCHDPVILSAVQRIIQNMIATFEDGYPSSVASVAAGAVASAAAATPAPAPVNQPQPTPPAPSAQNGAPKTEVPANQAPQTPAATTTVVTTASVAVTTAGTSTSTSTATTTVVTTVASSSGHSSNWHLHQLHFLQSCGFGGLWRFAGAFTKVTQSEKLSLKQI